MDHRIIKRLETHLRPFQRISCLFDLPSTTDARLCRVGCIHNGESWFLCGVCKFTMTPGELDESDVQVSWERYEYKNVNVKGDKMISYSLERPSD